MSVRFPAVVAIAVALASLGCGGEQKVRVSGTVTVDGEPLESGDITFVPDDPNKAAEGGRVVRGKYHMETWPGQNRVMISAVRPQKFKTPHGEQTHDVNYLPPRYHAQSELKADVPPRGSATFDFPLQLDKK